MDWVSHKLDSLLTIQNGYAFESKKFTTASGIPLIRIRDISNGFETVTNFDGDYDNKYLVKSGDFLIGMDGEFRCYEWKGEDALLNQRVCRLQDFSDKLYPKFLFYGINKYLKDIEDVTGFTTVKHISAKQIKDIDFPLPLISDQKRIVAILDEVFADIEQARTKTAQNLKNARELYLSRKAELFDELIKTADLKLLPSVCSEIFAGGDAPKKGFFSKTKTEKYQTPIYANAVKENGLYGFTDYSRANKPCITIAARGSGTGHIELRREPFLPIVRLIVLSPNEDVVYLDYFKHALQNLEILRSGSAIPQLTVPMIKEYSIPVPDLETQKKTIEELESLEELIELVIEGYSKKITLLDELKQSILQKAFSGELAQGASKEEVA